MGLFLLLLLIMGVAMLAFGAWVVVAVVSAVISALFAVGGHLLPVLMILLGGWLVWRAITDNGQRRRRDQHAQWGHHAPHQRAGDGQPASQSASSARGAGQSRRGAPATTATAPPLAKRELPIDVQVKAEQIQRKADLLLGYADRFPPFSQSLHIVRQTAADYLPRTLDAYLALPGLTDPIVPTTGRTALTELRAQLQLLDAKLDDITLDLQQQDLDRMSANRRFLEERFGMGTATDEVEPTDVASRVAPTLITQRASAQSRSAAAC